jgi:hypothetical protein
MRRNSTKPVGALHPILFFLLVYGISLFMALFVCRTIYFSIHETPTETAGTQMKAETAYSGTTGMSATALR